MLTLRHTVIPKLKKHNMLKKKARKMFAMVPLENFIASQIIPTVLELPQARKVVQD